MAPTKVAGPFGVPLHAVTSLGSGGTFSSCPFRPGGVNGCHCHYPRCTALSLIALPRYCLSLCRQSLDQVFLTLHRWNTHPSSSETLTDLEHCFWSWSLPPSLEVTPVTVTLQLGLPHPAALGASTVQDTHSRGSVNVG